ncbi:retrovirus-related pol polyprotein from transposon TNT 1-94 [Tanacetum coccineum]
MLVMVATHVPQTELNPRKENVQCYNCNEKGHYARDCLKPRVHDAKYFREQMLLAMKDEAGSNLNNEENDFMLDTSFDDDTMEELSVAVMLMAQIQPTDGNAETVPSYDAKAVSEVHASSKVHEQLSHEKRKTIIQTSDDDQIDSTIIFDDPYVENNGGTFDHDSNDHDKYHDFQMLAYNVQREAENQKRLNIELLKQKMLLQKELETCKDQLAKNVFKEQEQRYLEDICDLKEKLSSHDRIVYKLGQSIQTIHILERHQIKFMILFLKAGLGSKNLERLKKAIAAQPKMYDGEKLHSTQLVIHSSNSKETLEDAEESRFKMRNKMVQINYEKLNSLYETFVPQQELSVQQTYFSISSTSTNGYVSKEVTSKLPIKTMPKESKFLNMFDKMNGAIYALRARIDNTLLEDSQLKWLSDSQNSIREFYKNDVIPMCVSLTKNLKELREELIEEVQEMLNIFVKSKSKS